VIVLHISEYAANHGVLEVDWPLERRDFAREVPPHTEMLRAPGDSLPHADQSGRHSGGSYRLLTEMHIAREVNFHTPGKIKASFHWRGYRRKLFKLDHG
jgi:hypothetical protein